MICVQHIGTRHAGYAPSLKHAARNTTEAQNLRASQTCHVEDAHSAEHSAAKMNSLVARVVAAALLLVGTAEAFAPPASGLLAPASARDPALPATMIALPTTPRVMRGASVCMREKKEAEKGGLVTGIRWIFVQGGVDVRV